MMDGVMGIHSAAGRSLLSLTTSTLLYLASATIAFGQVTPDQEYRRYLAAAQTITPLSSFGERISLRNGALSFRQVDLELPGTGPTIRITRTFSVGNSTYNYVDSSGNRMGEWELSLPRLKTLTSAKTFSVAASSPRGWQVGSASNARCTQIGSPGPVIPLKAMPIESETWWAGYQFVNDQGEEENVLLTGSSPEPSAPTHVARTKSNWLIGCLPATSNGEPGEAFQAISPDGTRYWLDYLVYKDAPGIGPSGPGGMSRQYGSMLVTRVEDRHGNWLTYNYTSGILTSITASDGRVVTLSNNGKNITSVRANPDTANRLWNYNYTNTSLTSISLPDGSNWQFSLNDLPDSRIAGTTEIAGNCSIGHTLLTGLSGDAKSGSITSPSGATATFTVRALHIGRSNIPKFCWSYDLGSAEYYADIPKDSWAYAIVAKFVSGPGLPPSTWNYQYSNGNSSWDTECTSGCISTVWTDQTDPDGVRTRTTYSNRYGVDENLLLREEIFASGTGALTRTIEYTYAIAPVVETNSPYPWRSIGLDSTPRSNRYVSERWTPQLSSTMHQDGIVFKRVVNQYDARARALSVTNTSTVTP